MKISTILKTRGDWMSADAGTHPIVISSRVRLARNLAKLPFPGWAKKTERIRILDEIKPEVDNLAPMRNAFSEQLNELSALEKQVLVERHLISREHAAKGMGSAVAINSTQAISIMMNEEDHLRMQAITSGLELQKTFRMIDEVDTALEAHLDFAFDRSSCMGTVTTGSRCSVAVTFTPKAAGLRSGSVEIVDGNGNILATTLIHGIGQAAPASDPSRRWATR